MKGALVFLVGATVTLTVALRVAGTGWAAPFALLVVAAVFSVDLFDRRRSRP